MLMILEKVVDPEAIRTCRIRLWNCSIPLSETRRKHCAVRSFVCSFVRFQTPSLSVNCSLTFRILGRIRTSKFCRARKVSEDEYGRREATYAHSKEKLRIVLRVDRNEGVVPFDGSERSRESVLDVPEDGSTEVDVVLDQSHSTISGPTFLVVVTDEAGVESVSACDRWRVGEATDFSLLGSGFALRYR